MIRALTQILPAGLAGAFLLISSAHGDDTRAARTTLAANSNPTSTTKARSNMDTAQDKNQDVKNLWQAEHTWVRALETSNTDLLDGLIDGEFSFIGPDGEYEERQTYLAGYRAMPAQGVKVEKIDLADVKMRVLGDTGVVTGRALARVKFQGQLIVENVRFTRVYQRHADGWRMVAGQGTRLPAAEKAHQ